MAVPGETSCREVAPCGTTKWGGIPVESDTEYVDASFAGISDGSQAAPWTTIGDAIAAAVPGAMVAIASGTYAEDILIINKSVRLWGRCPAEVVVSGVGIHAAAIFVRTGASGTELHDLSVTNQDGAGVAVIGAEDVLVDRLWVHNTFYRGVDAEFLGPTSITLSRSLVEQTREFGFYAAGVEGLVDASVIRDALTDAQGLTGRGVDIKAPTTGERANVTVRGSLIERNREVGIFVIRSDAVVEATVVRDTTVNDQGLDGRGIVIQAHDSGARASGSVRACVVERNQTEGIFVSGSDALIEATVVRDSQLDPEERIGRGITFQDSAMAGPSIAKLRSSLVERNQEGGVVLHGSQVLIESTLVRDTQSIPAGLFGRGIGVQSNVMTGAVATATIRGSIIERSREVGVFGLAGDVTIESTAVRDSLPNPLGMGGHGINIEGDSTTGRQAIAAIRFSLVERSAELGVALFTADGAIENTLVRDTAPNAAGLYGDGVIVAALDADTIARIEGTSVANSTRGGILNSGALVTLRDVALRCQAFDMDGEEQSGRQFQFENRGNVTCGCPEPTGGCRVLSTGIDVPKPLQPPQ
jgi:hypothetical protein